MSYRRRRIRRPFPPRTFGPPPTALPADASRATVRRFDTTTDYLATCVGSPTGQSTDTTSSFWTSYVTLQDAHTLGRDGWAEGRERVRALAGNLVTQMAGRIMLEEWVPDVEGSYVDLGRYIAREPEYWMHSEELQSETGSARRHVRIVYNGTVSSGVPTEVIEARGAAISALCDLLELAGNAVTVELLFSVRGYGEASISDFVTIKASSERVDLAKLMFWLAHPASLRRLGFASWETFPESVRQTFSFYRGHGYGHCYDPNIEPKPDVYLGSGDIRSAEGRVLWTDVERVKVWLGETLQKMGVHLSEVPA